MGFVGASAESSNQAWPDLPSLVMPIPGVADEGGEPMAVSSTPAAQEELEVAETPGARCPQDRDCPAGGFASRIFECAEGCGFQGCAECMEIHEAEPHARDSLVSFEMARHSGVFG